MAVKLMAASNLCRYEAEQIVLPDETKIILKNKELKIVLLERQSPALRRIFRYTTYFAFVSLVFQLARFSSLLSIDTIFAIVGCLVWVVLAYPALYLAQARAKFVGVAIEVGGGESESNLVLSVRSEVEALELMKHLVEMYAPWMAFELNADDIPETKINGTVSTDLKEKFRKKQQVRLAA